MDRPQLTDKLSRLLASQKLAVLSTNKEGQPYSCLVAIAGTADLKHLLFCTARSTRKYGEIKDDPRVSVLIDNIANRESDFRDAFASVEFRFLFKFLGGIGGGRIAVVAKVGDTSCVFR